MALFDTPRLGASGATGGYEVSRSLRFNQPDNTYLVYQPSSDGNRRKWTWSGWVKRVRLDYTSYILFTSQNDGDGGGNNGVSSIYFGSDNKIHVYYDTTGSNHSGAINDNVYRDMNAWYHIVWQVDANNSTSKIFVNGISQTISSSTQPVSGYDYTMNQAGKRMTYGIEAWDLNSPASGYVAECHYSDGQLYDADVFAETDPDTGQWVPKQNPVITYGTNGHYLNFSDNSSVSALGTDFSGQGNHFTVNNLVVSSGIGNDSMKDTPTNNFATFNANLPIASSASYGNGNLEFSTSSSGQKQTTSTFAHDSGKWFAEFRLDSYSFTSGSYPYIGVIAADRFTQTWVGEHGTAVNTLGTAYNNSSVISGGFSYTAGDIIGMALDVDNLLVYFYKNGTIQNSGNGYAITARPGKGYQFSASLYASSGKWAANFGQIGVGSNSDANGHGNFTYAVPFRIFSRMYSKFR